MLSGKIVRRTAAVVAMVGMAMTPALVANAQTASAALACGGATAKTPWKVGTNIWGEGFAGSCSGDYRIFVERSRYYGWETMAASQWIRANEGTVVTYNCAGTGTHTFRAAVWKSGTGVIKTSGTFRTSC